MDHLLACELAGIFLILSCLPNWLAGKWYAARGALPALRRSIVISAVLALIGVGLTGAAVALEMRHAKPLLTGAFGMLGIAGLLVSAAFHAFDDR